MLPPQKVKVRWNTHNKSQYIKNGYKFTNMGDELYVDITEISPKSHYIIEAICDYCGKQLFIPMYNYTRSIENNSKIACQNCKNIKTLETFQNKYGTNCALQVDEFYEKTKLTNLKRYGVENPMQNKDIYDKQKQSVKISCGYEHPSQSPIIREKTKEMFLQKYGVSHPMKLSSIQEKLRQTIFEKYGVYNVSQHKQFVQRAKETCLKKYGGESSQCDPNIRKKTWETRIYHNNIPSSRPEQMLVEMLRDIYGEDKCCSQFVLDKVCFDCLLEVDDTKIDIEYDGWYWHKNSQERDKRRDYYVKSKGYKVLRIISNETIPSKNQIVEAINYLTQTNRNHYVIKLINIKDEDIV